MHGHKLCANCGINPVPKAYKEAYPHHCSLECFLNNPAMPDCPSCARGKIWHRSTNKECYYCIRKGPDGYNKRANDNRTAKRRREQQAAQGGNG